MNFITEHSIEIIVAAIIIVALGYLFYTEKKSLLAKTALYAVAKAEEAWGSDMGKVKFAEVYTYLKKEHPIVTILFTEKQLTNIIEQALFKLKEVIAIRIAEDEE